MIKLSNINKMILKDINLTIEKNSINILKGKNGSGKTTLLSIIGTITKPNSGEIIIDGENINRLNDIYLSQFRANKIGFVFQHFNLFDNLDIYENLFIVQAKINSNISKIDYNIDNMLRSFHIYDKKYKLVSSLSGGEKQKVAISRALINDPDILLFDEPTSALDRNSASKFLAILEKLKADGKTIVLTSHDTIFDNIDFIDQVISIEDGKIFY